MQFQLACEREDDGRWIAAIQALDISSPCGCAIARFPRSAQGSAENASIESRRSDCDISHTACEQTHCPGETSLD